MYISLVLPLIDPAKSIRIELACKCDEYLQFCTKQALSGTDLLTSRVTFYLSG